MDMTDKYCQPWKVIINLASIGSLKKFGVIKFAECRSAGDPWKSIHDWDSILHQAAYVGDVFKVSSLLEGVNKLDATAINARNRLGCTPLRLAASGWWPVSLKWSENCNKLIPYLQIRKCLESLDIMLKKIGEGFFLWFRCSNYCIKLGDLHMINPSIGYGIGYIMLSEQIYLPESWPFQRVTPTVFEYCCDTAPRWTSPTSKRRLHCL